MCASLSLLTNWPCLGQGFYWYFCLFSIKIHLWDWSSGNTSHHILQRQSKNVSFFPLQKKCVGVFVKELKSILSNVTVHNDDTDVITGIQTVLQKMEDQQPTANGQQVSSQRNNSRAFCGPRLLPCYITTEWIMTWRNTWRFPISISGWSDMFDEPIDKQSAAVSAVH